MAIPLDSTLRTIAKELKLPEEFVRRVLGNMAGLQRDCQIRLSLASNILYPDYQVEDFIFHTEEGEEVKIPLPIRIFLGRFHKELDYERVQWTAEWSGQAMHYTEIQTLLGELRNER